MNPEILLLDEPCSALDMKNTIAIEETLLELKGKIYICDRNIHNLAQAKELQIRLSLWIREEYWK